MAPFAGKRKRIDRLDHNGIKKKTASEPGNIKTNKQPSPPSSTTISKPARKADIQNGVNHPDVTDLTIQIITGDYERVIHGLAATIPAQVLRRDGKSSSSGITFSETFLLATHTASVRCLAVSPKAENGRRFLATGSADERINVYSISTTPPRPLTSKGAPTLNGSVIAENANNKSLGSLIHHDRAITRLHFPTKGKLFSAAEDNIVAISRTRDWTMLSSVKAPIPKVQGRPSGDTATPGEVPTGVNDFAIHPSQKLMLSVSKGERCMRLWNLMTGKKAGVLNFDRELLMQAGEGKHSAGEGRRVLWDTTGERYLVGFERGAALFGIDSKPRAICKPSTPTKFHQYAFVSGLVPSRDQDLLVVSTEDGRILLYDTTSDADDSSNGSTLPLLRCLAQIGGRAAGVASRIKDFVVIDISATSQSAVTSVVVAASSDGSIRLWTLDAGELDSKATSDAAPTAVGRLLVTHQTQGRITCLGAFVMDGTDEEPSHDAVDLAPAEITSDDDDESD